jgi:hypothetical protein
MKDLAPILGATAAAIAAILAGLNLFVSGRHERTKWIRETLVEVYVDFLAISAERSDIAIRAVRSRRAGKEQGALTELREQSDSAHGRHLDLLTRLRLLAIAQVIRAAQELHECDDALSKLAFGSVSPSDEDLDHMWSALWSERVRVIDAIRGSIHIRQGLPVEEMSGATRRTWAENQ